MWEPKIEQPNEFSLSQLWILGGSFGEDLNSIEAGWQVPPIRSANHIQLHGLDHLALVAHVCLVNATPSLRLIDG